MTDRPPHPGRIPAQRKALDAIGCGDYSPIMASKVRTTLLAEGLIVQCGEKVVGRDALDAMRCDIATRELCRIECPPRGGCPAMTRAEIVAYNAGVWAALDQARLIANVIEARTKRPIAEGFAIEALRAFADAGGLLMQPIPPAISQDQSHGC